MPVRRSPGKPGRPPGKGAEGGKLGIRFPLIGNTRQAEEFQVGLVCFKPASCPVFEAHDVGHGVKQGAEPLFADEKHGVGAGGMDFGPQQLRGASLHHGQAKHHRIVFGQGAGKKLLRSGEKGADCFLMRVGKKRRKIIPRPAALHMQALERISPGAIAGCNGAIRLENGEGKGEGGKDMGKIRGKRHLAFFIKKSQGASRI